MLQILFTFLGVALLAVPFHASAISIDVTVSQLEKVSGVDPQSPTAGSFTQNWPIPTNYSISEDFEFFISGSPIPPPYDPVLGTVSGQLGVILSDGLGCFSGNFDFSGFQAGQVALIDGGICDFSDLVNIAADAGASAAITNTSSPLDSSKMGLVTATSIPSIVISETLHDEFLSQLSNVNVPITLATESTIIYENSTVVNKFDQQSGSSGFITSHVEGCPTDCSATSLASEDGRLAVTADSASAGSFDVNEVTATAEWNETVTNTGGLPKAYTFDFTIPGGEIYIIPGGPAEYRIQILQDGASLWESSASLIDAQGPLAHKLTQTGVDLGLTLDPRSGCARYTFNDFSDSLNLGVFEPDDSFTLTYKMSASGGPSVGDEDGGFAGIGDPADLSSNPWFPGVRQVPVNADVFTSLDFTSRAFTFDSAMNLYVTDIADDNSGSVRIYVLSPADGYSKRSLYTSYKTDACCTTGLVFDRNETQLFISEVYGGDSGVIRAIDNTTFAIVENWYLPTFRPTGIAVDAANTIYFPGRSSNQSFGSLYRLGATGMPEIVVPGFVGTGLTIDPLGNIYGSTPNTLDGSSFAEKSIYKFDPVTFSSMLIATFEKASEELSTNILGNLYALNKSTTESTIHEITVADTDGDGIPNRQDNCIFLPNGPVEPDAGGNSQLDTDGDGYGNSCDPDFDNNVTVDFADLADMKSNFFTDDSDADLDGNGTVDFADLAIMKSMFFGPPGPSGINP